KQNARSQMHGSHLCAGKGVAAPADGENVQEVFGQNKEPAQHQAVRKFHDLNFRWPIQAKDINSPAVSNINGTRTIFTCLRLVAVSGPVSESTRPVTKS